MDSRSVVTAWNPPRTFVREGAGWVPGSPPIATEFSVEARAGWRLRRARGAEPVLQHGRLGRATDRRPRGLARHRPHPATLSPRTSAGSDPRSCGLWLPVPGTAAEAWATLTTAVGLKGVSVGQRWTAPASVPAFSGVAEYISQSPFGRSAAARQAGAGNRRLGHHRVRRRSDGDVDLFLYRRSGGRKRRPRNAALGSMVSKNTSRCRPEPSTSE